jgi:hypothetical protein
MKKFVFGMLVLVFLSLLVLGVLRQANPLKNGLSLDSGYYLYIGQQVLHGKLPYLDAWESKPPGVFYVNAFAMWLGRETRWGVWLVEFTFLLVSSALGFFVMRRAYGLLPAALGTITWLAGLNAVLQGGNLTEEYSLLFNFAAIALFWYESRHPAARWPAFGIGLSFAASFLFRPNNAGVQVAIVLAWLASAVLLRNWQNLAGRLVRFALGVLLPLAAVSLYFASIGALDELVKASFLYNLYLTEARSGLLESLVRGLQLIGIPAGFALLGYFVHLDRTLESRRADPWSLFLLVGLPLEAVLSGLSGRGYPHYYISWMPAIGLLSAAMFGALGGRLSAWTERRAVQALVLLIAAVLLFSGKGLLDYHDAFVRLAFAREQGVELEDPVASYVRAHTQPQDTTLVWGARLGINVQARRASPCAYLFYPLFVDSPYTAGMADQFFADLQRQPPVLVVDASTVNQDLMPAIDPVLRAQQEKTGKLWPTLPANIQAVYDFFEGNYHLVDTLNGYSIYRLNGTDG